MSSKLFSKGWIDVSKISLNEADTNAITAGEYNGPQEIGMRKWTDSELAGFTIMSDNPLNKVNIERRIKNNVKRFVGGWEPGENNFEVPVYDVDSHVEIKVDSNGVADTDLMSWYKDFKSKKPIVVKSKKPKKTIKEDLGVWFGTKKKPKGSSQPKGPWVNICRKEKDGGHPPCGRPDADPKGYPKCRAAGVASKMSDAQKRAACQQKRTAEKKDTQTGKGQKPVMTSYKPKNESIMKKTIKLTESDLMGIVRKVLKEQLTQNFDYKMYRDDSFRESTTGKALYFVKNGKTYDVWYEDNTGEIISGGVKLPTRDELGIVFKGTNEETDKPIFGPNKAAILGRSIIRTITTGQGMGNSIPENFPTLLVFTDNDGLPKKATLSYGHYPLDTFKGNEMPLKKDTVAIGDDYFVTTKPNRKDKIGWGAQSSITGKLVAAEPA